MRDQRYHLLTDRAAMHHGVFTRREALELGISESSLFDALANGRYRKIWPGVYAVAGSPDTLWQQLAAAVLSVPAPSALSHRTAAELWGLTDRGIKHIDVVTTRWDRVRREGINYHESLDLVESDVEELGGLPVTTPVRTVVDLGAVSPWQVERAFEAGVRRGLLTIDRVESFVSRVARKGRRGVGVIRPLLEARRKWDGVTESALEDMFLKTIYELDLPVPQKQYVLRDEDGLFVCRADFAYPHSRVLIELDSEAHHMDRLSFRRDRSKQNRAAGLGWSTLRFTWWDLQDDPYQVVAHIKAMLAGRRPA